MDISRLKRVLGTDDSSHRLCYNYTSLDDRSGSSKHKSPYVGKQMNGRERSVNEVVANKLRVRGVNVELENKKG